MLGKIRRIHFVGIGGIGMSGIAEVLLNLGFTVSGSDLKRTGITERLESLGARIFEGHAATNVQDAQVVVVSSAVPPDNPELAEARRLHVPVIARAEMLAELMRLKFCVAVTGAHGKTTVTSMISVLLAQAGLDPTAVIGGRLDAFGSSARLGKGDLMVVEADESDRSFLYLIPSIAVVTNIDREHLDHYRDLEEISAAFVSFMNRVPFYGAVIACTDPVAGVSGASLRSVLPQVRRRIVTYGLEPGAEVTAEGIDLNAGGATFKALAKGKLLGEFGIHVPGRHNVQNALAAVAVGLELGLSGEQLQQGLEKFRGVDRRFQLKGVWEGVTVVDDYGHHPTEIRATLDAARLMGPKRLWAIFQPHRYTRTKLLMDDFARCFSGCDRVYVVDIYPASEPPLPGVTSDHLVQRMRELGYDRARYAASDQEVVLTVLREAQPGDLIVTIGAGSVWKTSEALAAALRNRVESGAGLSSAPAGTGGKQHDFGTLPRQTSQLSARLASDPEMAREVARLGAEWLPMQPLSDHTSLSVGGPANLVRIYDLERLPGLMDYLDRRGLSWRILGGGSNLLVRDEGLEDVVVQLVRPKNGVTFDGNRVEVAAAANLGTAVMECAKRNLGGMEGLIGVPGTVGGALRMNAGAYGIEIGPLVRSLAVYHGSAGKIEVLKTQEVRFEYRHSSFAPDDIMLSVSLELPSRDYAEILEKIKLFNQKRRASQPINEKSAGCIFKNPPGFSAGRMIDELGLKGTREGGAVISERHANFFVNRYQATASDLLTLMDRVRERVLRAYGVELEEEVIVWRS